MKKIAILQSNYVPWKGYFDIIASVDEFIIYDDVQYTKNDWRNRNQIKTRNGCEWLTIPTGQSIDRTIREVTLNNPSWQKKHWRTLQMNYSLAACFEEIAQWLEPLYIAHSYTHLSEVNRAFIEAICRYLGIDTVLKNAWEYEAAGGQTERLVDLCVQAGATEYVSGPAAQAYIDESVFEEQGVTLTWFDYSGYPEYPQLWGDFVHAVSVLDTLFNCGAKASQYVRRVRQ